MPKDPYKIPRMRRSRRVGTEALVRPPSLAEPLPVTPKGGELLEATPEQVAYFMQVVSRERAMRAWRLVKRGVQGTLPELLTYDWLETRGFRFDFQSSLMGGRLILGGAVADFIIEDLSPDGLVVWRVQGDYWHANAAKAEKDQAQKERLLRERYLNQPIIQVVDLWESAIYKRAPRVFLAAEVGEELGPAWGAR